MSILLSLHRDLGGAFELLREFLPQVQDTYLDELIQQLDKDHRRLKQRLKRSEGPERSALQREVYFSRTWVSEALLEKEKRKAARVGPRVRSGFLGGADISAGATTRMLERARRQKSAHDLSPVADILTLLLAGPNKNLWPLKDEATGQVVIPGQDFLPGVPVVVTIGHWGQLSGAVGDMSPLRLTMAKAWALLHQPMTVEFTAAISGVAGPAIRPHIDKKALRRRIVDVATA